MKKFTIKNIALIGVMAAAVYVASFCQRDRENGIFMGRKMGTWNR